jgi:hypothetical protein
MSYQGAQGGKLIFSGGINHPIPITIPTKHFGARKRSHRKRSHRKRSRKRRSKRSNRKLRRSTHKQSIKI